jgi:predicted nucleotidyltransferase
VVADTQGGRHQGQLRARSFAAAALQGQTRRSGLVREGREPVVRKVNLAEPLAHESSDVATAFARRVGGLWHDQLGKRLAGVYLIGSLAHGGYRAAYSDIDMALISQTPLTAADFDVVNSKIALASAVLALKVSLFWTDATFSAGRFPTLDRIDYLDHRVVLLERCCLLPKRPTLREVRIYLSADPLRKWSAEVMRLTALPDLLAQDRKPYLRAILYPARFLYSWETGRVASNDEAVAYVDRCNLAGAAVDLLTRALRCRNGEDDVSLLFPERRRLDDLFRICTEYVRSAREQ